MIKYLFLILFVNFVNFGNAQSKLKYSAFYSSGTIVINSVVVNNEGESYLGGYFSKTADFDTGDSLLNITFQKPTSSSYPDGFIVKLDEDGNFLWSKTFGKTESDLVGTLALDDDENLYVTGYFKGTSEWDSLDFDFGPNEHYLKTKWNFRSAFILKLNPDGDFIWVKGIGYSDLAPENRFDINPGKFIIRGENIYLLGNYNGDADFDGGPDTAIMTSNDQDIFLMNIDTSGEFKWIMSQGGGSFDFASDFTFSGKGDIFMTGTFRRTAYFGGDTIVAQGTSDMFLQKIDSLGKSVWTKTISNDRLFAGQSISSTDSNLYICSNFNAATDLDFTDNTLNSSFKKGFFIQKTDLEGELIWVKTFEADVYNIVPRYIRNDIHGNAFIYGNFVGTVNFATNKEKPIYKTSSGGSSDLFVLKLDPAGNLDYIRTFGGNGSAKSECMFLKNNNIHVTATFTGAFNLDTTNDETITSKSNSGNGIFLEFAQCPPRNLSISDKDGLLKVNTLNKKYQWLNCFNTMNPILSENEYLFSPSQNGSYAIEVNSSGCIDTSDCFNFLSVNTIHVNEKSKVDIYPNPTKDFIHIVSDYEISSVEVFDINGNVILFRSPFKKQLNLDLSLQPKGVYVLKVKNKEYKHSQNIILK